MLDLLSSKDEVRDFLDTLTSAQLNTVALWSLDNEHVQQAKWVVSVMWHSSVLENLDPTVAPVVLAKLVTSSPSRLWAKYTKRDVFYYYAQQLVPFLDGDALFYSLPLLGASSFETVLKLVDYSNEKLLLFYQCEQLDVKFMKSLLQYLGTQNILDVTCLPQYWVDNEETADFLLNYVSQKPVVFTTSAQLVRMRSLLYYADEDTVTNFMSKLGNVTTIAQDVINNLMVELILRPDFSAASRKFLVQYINTSNVSADILGVVNAVLFSELAPRELAQHTLKCLVRSTTTVSLLKMLGDELLVNYIIAVYDTDEHLAYQALRMWVLRADDEAQLLRVVAHVLEKQGYSSIVKILTDLCMSAHVANQVLRMVAPSMSTLSWITFLNMDKNTYDTNQVVELIPCDVLFVKTDNVPSVFRKAWTVLYTTKTIDVYNVCAQPGVELLDRLVRTTHLNLDAVVDSVIVSLTP